ncbi:MAG: hypothetical protein V3R86_06750 [Candidatus Hydrothermarchaeaceae archaeon]
MREIQLSEENFRRLIKHKNHWSFQNGQVTNPKVQKVLGELKSKVFGYGAAASNEEIERISHQKSRDQLEDEMERFSRVLDGLLVSGYDFDPSYTIDDHIKKMIESIDEGF